MPENSIKVRLKEKGVKVVNGQIIVCHKNKGIFDINGKSDGVYIYDDDFKDCVFQVDSCEDGIEKTELYKLERISSLKMNTKPRDIKEGEKAWNWKRKKLSNSLWALLKKMDEAG